MKTEGRKPTVFQRVTKTSAVPTTGATHMQHAPEQRPDLRSPGVPAPEGSRVGKTARIQTLQALIGKTFAAIDLGSSSGKMLVQKIGIDGKLRTIVDVKIGTQLGKDVRNGERIPLENQQRALDALKKFIDEAARLGVQAQDIPVITTAVVRNAKDGDDFLARIHELGLVKATVLSGDEEANAGYRGALMMMNGAPGKYATLDLGGGSFQLAVGTEEFLTNGGSTQIGSNEILDDMLMPLAAEHGAGKPEHLAVVDAKLAERAKMPIDLAELRGRTLVATGGVSKFLRAHFGRDVIRRDEIDALRREIIVLPFEERVALVQQAKDETTMKALGVETHKGALDYGKKLPASASLLLRILDALGVDEVRVSETDARHFLISTSSAIAGT